MEKLFLLLAKLSSPRIPVPLDKQAHFFTGVWSILNVNNNGVVGAGNGPFSIIVGNTVTFSISGTDLVATFVVGSGSLQYATVLLGAAAA